jgi:hypothetical protein
MRTCDVSDCSDTHYARGMCNKHWKREYRTRNIAAYGRELRGNAVRSPIWRARRRKEPKNFLMQVYSRMLSRVRGQHRVNAHYYKNLPIMSREDFFCWSESDEQFKKLYRSWQISGFDNQYLPTVDRLNSDKGYTLDNVEWVTYPENVRRASLNRWGNR